MTRASLHFGLASALLPMLALFALVFGVWGFALKLPINGADTWSIILQGDRALSNPADFFQQRYLQGMLDGILFWRPAFTGLFGLQWRLFGDQAQLYHFLRLAAYGLLACQAGFLAARFGSAKRAGMLVAGAVLLLHPAQAAMIPSVARSADVMSDILIAGTLLLCTGPLTRTRLLGAFLCAGMAGLTKESGLVAPVLGAFLLQPWRNGKVASARRLTCVAMLSALAANMFWRFELLGTLGSYKGSVDESSLVEGLATMLSGFFNHEGREVWIASLLLWAGWGWTLYLMWSRSNRDTPREGSKLTLPFLTANQVCIAIALCAWVGAVMLGALDSPRLATRHATSLLVPSAALLGGLLGQSLMLAHGKWMRTAVLGTQLLVLVAILFPNSPLTTRYPQWQTIGRANRLFFGALEEALQHNQQYGAGAMVEFGKFKLRVQSSLDGGLRVSAHPMPRKAKRVAGPGVADVDSPMVLLEHSAESWLHLHGYGPNVSFPRGEGYFRLRDSDLGPIGVPVSLR